MIIPKDSEFENDSPGRKESWVRRMFQRRQSERITIANSYNLIKILISIGQLVFAISTLYRTRGDQIALFGYAAFGLTVTPYAVMSLVNLLGCLLCPQYSTVFLVENVALDTLLKKIRSQEKTAQFPVISTVGRLTEKSEAKALSLLSSKVGDSHRSPPLRSFQPIPGEEQRVTGMVGASFWVLAVPLSIIGGLSHFSEGESKGYQRGLTMTWLVFGFFAGAPLVTGVEKLVEPRPFMERSTSFGLLRGSPYSLRFLSVTLFLSIVMYAGPAIGGFTVVGKMMLQYGSCFRL